MGSKVITACNLSKRFGNVLAIDSLDISVERASVYGFLGPNGSGKTTIIRILCGLLTPTSGDIRVLGLKIPEQIEKLRKKIGYMTQQFSLFEDLTVRENLEFIAAMQDIPVIDACKRIDQLIDQFRFQGMEKMLAGVMSGGQKQRLALASAVIHEPELLFLDEPTSAVDPESRRDFWSKLFELADVGTTIMVSTHLMDEAERCHRIAILNCGVLVADNTPAILTKRLEGCTWLVDTMHPSHAQQLLSAVPSVLGVVQIGNSLRVLSRKNECTDTDLRTILLEVGVDAHVSPVDPNIEDVFVAVTRSDSTQKVEDKL